MSSGARAQPNAFWVVDTIYDVNAPVAYRHAIDLNTCSQSTNPVLFDAFFSIYGDYLDLTLPQMNSSFFTSGPGDAVPDHVLGMSIPPMYNPAPARPLRPRSTPVPLHPGTTTAFFLRARAYPTTTCPATQVLI